MKVKFNMCFGDGSGEVLDFFMDDYECWFNFGWWCMKQMNNNMGGVCYLLVFVQYYFYGL